MCNSMDVRRQIPATQGDSHLNSTHRKPALFSRLTCMPDKQFRRNPTTTTTTTTTTTQQSRQQRQQLMVSSNVSRISGSQKTRIGTRDRNVPKYCHTTSTKRRIMLPDVVNDNEFPANIDTGRRSTDSSTFSLRQPEVVNRDFVSFDELMTVLNMTAVGPTPEAARCGLDVTSHPVGVVSLPLNQREPEMTMTFVKRKKVEFSMTSQFKRFKKSTESQLSVTECDDFVFQTPIGESKIQFGIRLPERGFYVLKIFVSLLPQSSESSTFNVFNYIIHAERPTRNQRSFPMAYAGWLDRSSRYVLVEPRYGEIPSNTDIQFTIKSSDNSSQDYGDINRKLFIISDTRRIPLWQQVGSNGSITWTSDVTTGKRGTKLKVVAVLNDDITVDLLQFSVVASDQERAVDELIEFENDCRRTETERLLARQTHEMAIKQTMIDNELKYTQCELDTAKQRLDTIVNERKNHLERADDIWQNLDELQNAEYRKYVELEISERRQATAMKARLECRLAELVQNEHSRAAAIRRQETNRLSDVEASLLNKMAALQRKSVSPSVLVTLFPAEAVAERHRARRELMDELARVRDEALNDVTLTDADVSELKAAQDDAFEAVNRARADALLEVSGASEAMYDRISEARQRRLDAVGKRLEVIARREKDRMEKQGGKCRCELKKAARIEMQSINVSKTVDINVGQSSRNRLITELGNIDMNGDHHLSGEQCYSINDEFATLSRNRLRRTKRRSELRAVEVQSKSFSRLERLRQHQRCRIRRVRKAFDEEVNAARQEGGEEMATGLRWRMTPILGRLTMDIQKTVERLAEEEKKMVDKVLDAGAKATTEVTELYEKLLQELSCAIADAGCNEIACLELSTSRTNPERVEEDRHAETINVRPTNETPQEGQQILEENAEEHQREAEEQSDTEIESHVEVATEIDVMQSIVGAHINTKRMSATTLSMYNALKQVVMSASHPDSRTPQAQPPTNGDLTAVIITSRPFAGIRCLKHRLTTVSLVIDGTAHRFASTMTALKDRELHRLVEMVSLTDDRLGSVDGLKRCLERRIDMMYAYDNKAIGRLATSFKIVLGEMWNSCKNTVTTAAHPLDGVQDNHVEQSVNEQLALIPMPTAALFQHTADTAAALVEKEFSGGSGIVKDENDGEEFKAADKEEKQLKQYDDQAIDFEDIRKKVSDMIEIARQQEYDKTEKVQQEVMDYFWKNVHQLEEASWNVTVTRCDLIKSRATEMINKVMHVEHDTISELLTRFAEDLVEQESWERRAMERFQGLEASRFNEIGQQLQADQREWVKLRVTEIDKRLIDIQLQIEDRIDETRVKFSDNLSTIRDSRRLHYIADIRPSFLRYLSNLRTEMETDIQRYSGRALPLAGRTRHHADQTAAYIEETMNRTCRDIQHNEEQSFANTTTVMQQTFNRLTADYTAMFDTVIGRQTAAYAIARVVDREKQMQRTMTRLTERQKASMLQQQQQERRKSAGRAINDELKEAAEKRLRDARTFKRKLRHILGNERQMGIIRQWIQDVEDQTCDVELVETINLAWKTIYRLDGVISLRDDLLRLDPRSVAAVVSRQPADNPDSQLFDHQTLIAFLLTLGVHEGLTTKWEDCQRHLVTAGSTSSIKRRVRQMAGVCVEIALRVVQLIGDVDAQSFDLVMTDENEYDDDDDEVDLEVSQNEEGEDASCMEVNASSRINPQQQSTSLQDCFDAWRSNILFSEVNINNSTEATARPEDPAAPPTISTNTFKIQTGDNWSILSAVTFLATEQRRFSLAPTYDTDETLLTALSPATIQDSPSKAGNSDVPKADQALKTFRRWALTICRNEIDTVKWRSPAGILPPAANTVDKQIRLLLKEAGSALKPSLTRSIAPWQRDTRVSSAKMTGSVASGGPLAGPRRALFDNFAPPLPRITLS